MNLGAKFEECELFPHVHSYFPADAEIFRHKDNFCLKTLTPVWGQKISNWNEYYKSFLMVQHVLLSHY